jgi:hypothetical protein
MNSYRELEYLSLAGLSSLVKCLQIRLEPTRVKPLSGAPLQDRFLALPIGVRVLPEGDCLDSATLRQAPALLTTIRLGGKAFKGQTL